MRPVTYSLAMSLDGYVMGPDGGFDWANPDQEMFDFVTDEIREVGAHILGRRLYETMLYWDTADQDPTLDVAERVWAELWKAIPKVVFSSSLTEVRGANTRLASRGLADEINELRSLSDEGFVAIGGASLAAEASALDLIDEYRMRVFPVLVGGGTPYFRRDNRHSDLELMDSRSFKSGVVYLRYHVRRP
jgi:dihydrofolate reductase